MERFEVDAEQRNSTHCTHLARFADGACAALFSSTYIQVNGSDTNDRHAHSQQSAPELALAEEEQREDGRKTHSTPSTGNAS